MQNIKKPLSFVDYEKAFDSVETKAIPTSLEQHGIENGYTNIVTKVSNGWTIFTSLHKESKEKSVHKGVRQSEKISPKLFTATAEGYSATFVAMIVNRSKHSNLIFADNYRNYKISPSLETPTQRTVHSDKQKGLKSTWVVQYFVQHVDQR